MTKTYPANVVASITTRRLLCPFGDMHECIEYLMNRPVWTHEMANKELFERLKNGILEQHPSLSEIDGDSINQDNYAEHTKRILERFGQLEIEPIKNPAKLELPDNCAVIVV